MMINSSESGQQIVILVLLFYIDQTGVARDKTNWNWPVFSQLIQLITYSDLYLTLNLKQCQIDLDKFELNVNTSYNLIQTYSHMLEKRSCEIWDKVT